MGALLKGGRYRLLQRFLVDTRLRTQANEPPLLVASDAEAPGVRVLVQELALPASLNGARGEGEIMRQAITERLYAFAPDAHFPTLVDSFTEHGRQFLVFASPSGDLLNDRLARARGPLPEREVVEYALRTLDALSALERGRPPLTHGALCPAHIILRPSGAVTLVGFSPALLVAPPVVSGGLITVGLPSGIVGYAAPEQERGQASARSDLYSLGAIMSYAATGVAPSQQAGALHQPVRRLNPDLSLEFEEVVGRAMRAAAAQRFQSAEEMRQALQAIEPRGRSSLPDLSASANPALREATSAHVSLTARNARRPRNLTFVFALVVALIALIGGVAAVALTHRGAPGAPGGNPMASTPNPSAALYQQKGIGVSGGDFVFDFRGADASQKQSAVRALAAGDQRQAYTDYLQAIAASPADAEAAIYAENLSISIHHNPYVTIVVGVAFDGETAMAGATGQDILARDQLQGVYQAQENANTSHLLPGGEQVQVLIANSGATPTDAGAVAQAIAAELRAGNPQHIIGMVSWPGVAETQAAAAVLSPTGLPLLGTRVGVDGLPGADLNDYFAIVPTMAQQGAELATAATQQLGATHILVAQNPQNLSSMSMAQGFEQQITYLQQHQLAIANVTSAQNFTPGSASSYAAIAQQAANQGATLIFLSGADQDAVALAQATHHQGGGIHILVGPQADTAALYGMGADPLAQIARQNVAALAALYVTTFANASEAIAINAANSSQALFEANYQGVFGHTAVPSGLPDPDPQTILGYDAATALLMAAAPIDQGTVVYPSILQMRNSLLVNNNHRGFPGISGQIAFGPDGGQPEKALAILALAPIASPSGAGPVVTISLLAVVGGAKVYCGTVGCTS
jgi:serine/threonine protein kinase